MRGPFDQKGPIFDPKRGQKGPILGVIGDLKWVKKCLFSRGKYGHIEKGVKRAKRVKIALF